MAFFPDTKNALIYKSYQKCEIVELTVHVPGA